jgi:hypothetical protein
LTDRRYTDIQSIQEGNDFLDIPFAYFKARITYPLPKHHPPHTQSYHTRYQAHSPTATPTRSTHGIASPQRPTSCTANPLTTPSNPLHLPRRPPTANRHLTHQRIVNAQYPLCSATPLHNALQFFDHQRLQLLLAHPSFVTRQTHKHKRSTAHKEIRHLNARSTRTNKQTNKRTNTHKHTKMTAPIYIPATFSWEYCTTCTRPGPHTPLFSHTKCIHGLYPQDDLTPTEISIQARAESHGGSVAGIWLPCATPGCGCGCTAGVFRLRDALKACVRRHRRDGAEGEVEVEASEHVFRRRDVMARLPTQWMQLVEKDAYVGQFSPYHCWLALFFPGYAILRGWW